MSIKAVSMEEAKRHWKRTTKRAFNIKPKWEDWRIREGVPVVTTDKGTFYFYHAPFGGHIYGSMNWYADEGNKKENYDMDFFKKKHKPLDEEPDYYKDAVNIVREGSKDMTWESEQERQEYLEDAEQAMQETVEHDRQDRKKRGFFNW